MQVLPTLLLASRASWESCSLILSLNALIVLSCPMGHPGRVLIYSSCPSPRGFREQVLTHNNSCVMFNAADVEHMEIVGDREDRVGRSHFVIYFQEPVSINCVLNLALAYLVSSTKFLQEIINVVPSEASAWTKERFLKHSPCLLLLRVKAGVGLDFWQAAHIVGVKSFVILGLDSWAHFLKVFICSSFPYSSPFGKQVRTC